MKSNSIVLFSFILMAFFSACSDSKQTHHQGEIKEVGNSHHHESDHSLFYCPMKCEGEKTYEKSGECPVCGMDLVDIEE